jgi:hypothetical protein
MTLRKKLHSNLHHRPRPGSGRPRRVLDLGLLPMSHSSKVQQLADDAVETGTPRQKEREEFGTEL